ncbi:MAG: FAD-dependent oxidoreductase [Deltaproteobacteria bacterium]|nr:FAD-dependent oxidoreductase [Deltaproteobacteria bacterium]
MQSQSFWTTESSPSFLPLHENIEAEVCIIGAGMVGLSCGYLLSREGKSVVILDEGQVVGGESGRTTAHLTNAVDDRYTYIEDLHGEENARLVARSHFQAIETIEEIVNREAIDCDFERVAGYLFMPPDGDRKDLQKELEAARRAGVVHIEEIPRAPFDFYDTGPALLFGGQGQFHPVKYLYGLVRCIQSRGGRIFTATHVNHVHDNKHVEVLTDQGFHVIARSAIVATNVPINDRVLVHTKQAAYRTYVIAAPIPHGAVPKALFWDGPFQGKPPAPYHYIRTAKQADGSEMLLIGGEDHKVGQKEDTLKPYLELEKWARERFPSMGNIAFQWSGQVLEPVDGLPFIGRNPLERNVYIATGDSGMGMTHGTIAGLLMTDLILERENPWAKLYDPSRKTVAAAGRYLRENANAVAQYKDWLKRGDAKTIDDVTPGMAAIVQQGLKKVAVYRDQENIVHKVSATCPHLGGVVAWNEAEQTWDCPVHGSRFDKDGRVIHGPAISDLTCEECGSKPKPGEPLADE